MLCQCPKCETIFRLSREQLDSADGQVSCSVCQFEFDAYESLIPEPGDKTAAEPPVEVESTPGNDHVPIIVIEDDDDEMSVLFSASLEDQDDLPGDIEQIHIEAAIPDSAPESAPESEQGLASEATPVAEPEQQELDNLIPDYMESARSDSDAGGLSEQLESELMEAGLRNAAIGTHRMRRLIWNSGAVLLILALGLQFIYVIRDELAQSSSYRPWIETYCRIIGCNIPLRRELQSIELLQREISQDPDQDNVLRVRAMFVNQAAFKQAYPIVQVTLSNTSNQIIAMRQLHPEEYLLDQPVKQGMIPGRQVILELRFFKPEQPVSTYEFDFL